MPRKISSGPLPLQIDSLSHDARGVGRHNGKAVFVEGALPGEQVTVRLQRRYRNYDLAQLISIDQASPQRVTPRCAHFAQCGGCSLQHLDIAAQIEMKQRLLADNLTRIGHVEPVQWLSPMQEEVWGYRRRARLGVRYVQKKGRVLVGFREKAASMITDTAVCEVLYPQIGGSITRLADTIGRLSIRERVPQVEVAVGDTQVVLVLRVLAAPDDKDLELLRELAQTLGVALYLQPGGVDSLQPLVALQAPLGYELPDWNLRLRFEPQDFSQVNMSINRRMIARAMDHLQVEKSHTVLDLFCGLGNFSLPMARVAGRVIGVEADEPMVARARENAALNGIDNCEFHAADLFLNPAATPLEKLPFDRVLLDPPRSGAEEVCRWLCRRRPQRIVYVSCNPSTLARDAGLLVNEGNYVLERAGVMDMFPHTAHVEAMAVFAQSG